MKVKLKRLNDKFHFEGINEQGVKIQMDAGSSIGGQDLGVRPMQMLLMGLGGCSGIDIGLILSKQRQFADSFEIEIDGMREPNVEPSLFEEIKVDFRLTGNLDSNKVKRAVELSMTKYCSVAKTLERTAIMVYRIEVNGQCIKDYE